MNFLRIQKERIQRVYYRFLWWRPVWLYLLNGKSRRLFRKDKKALTEEQSRISREIAEKGIAISSVEKLLGKERWDELQSFVYTRLADPAVQKEILEKKSVPAHRGDKYFNVELWGLTDIDIRDPLVRFGIDTELLGIASTYMEMWVKWRGGRLWATQPVPAGAAPHASQRWHRDPEDTKMLKVFIYFNDIDAESGPFTYVQYSHGGGKYRGLFPQVPPIGVYPPDGSVESAVAPEDVRIMTGKAGSVIFCDTSGLHKGGYAKSKPRYMSQTVYASCASSEPVSYSYPAHFSTKTLSPEAEYAVSN